MYYEGKSIGILGIEGFMVKVEADIGRGMPGFNIVGLPDTAIREARERIKTAIVNSGYKFPNKKIVLNLSPADVRKEGSHFDLSMALLILQETEKLQIKELNEGLFLGELSLNGKIRSIRGVLPMILKAKENKISPIIIPTANLKEVGMLEDRDSIYGANSLDEVVEFLRGNLKLETPKGLLRQKKKYDLDFSDVKGNFEAKRACEISAAGHHHLFLVGAPGSGKTMIARRLPGIMEDLEEDEILKISRIYSVTELQNPGLEGERPFRAPHHSITRTGLIGGGFDSKPGEIVLSNGGVLFLDEALEFDRRVLDSLRQPVEDREILLSRVKTKTKYPCDFIMVFSANNCLCNNRECRCADWEIKRYLGRVSGPLLDRFDLYVDMLPIEFSELTNEACDEYTTEQMKSRVEKAVEIQKNRYKGRNYSYNGQMPASDISKFIKLSSTEKEFLEMAFEKVGLSARSYHKLLKISRTIADLEGSELVEVSHLAQGLSYRKAYEKYWG